METYKFDETMIRQFLREFKVKLTYQERMILWWKFCEDKTLEEIGNIINRTPQAVSQSYKKAINKLSK